MINLRGYIKQYSRVSIGGTFQCLHAGHKAYINHGFRVARKVIIHIASNEYIKEKKKYDVKPFDIRKEAVVSYVKSQFPFRKSEIVKIDSEDDLIESLSTNKIDCALVEMQYLPRFSEMNRLRKKMGLSEIEVILRDRLRLTENDVDISSSLQEIMTDDHEEIKERIKNKEECVKLLSEWSKVEDEVSTRKQSGFLSFSRFYRQW